MFFKKQAFKIKDLLKEKGIDLPLVTVQEILAKSYGFNNRHVALSDKNFLKSLENSQGLELNPEDVQEVAKPNNTLLKDFPYEISEANIINYSFYWDYNNNHCPIHFPTSSPNSPFALNHFSETMHFTILVPDEAGELKPTLLKYSYNKQKKSFLRHHPIFTLLEQKGLKPIFRNFNNLEITLPEVTQLLEAGKDYWDLEKRVILHKDCPFDIVKSFTTHKEFYVRITAFFAKRHRHILAPEARKDKDMRVRKIFYRYLLGETETHVDTIRAMLREDPDGTRLMRDMVINDEEERLVNWN